MTTPELRLRAAALRYLAATTARIPTYSWKLRGVALDRVRERNAAENELRAALAATEPTDPNPEERS